MQSNIHESNFPMANHIWDKIDLFLNKSSKYASDDWMFFITRAFVKHFDQSCMEIEYLISNNICEYLFT